MATRRPRSRKKTATAPPPRRARWPLRKRSGCAADRPRENRVRQGRRHGRRPRAPAPAGRPDRRDGLVRTPPRCQSANAPPGVAVRGARVGAHERRAPGERRQAPGPHPRHRRHGLLRRRRGPADPRLRPVIVAGSDIDRERVVRADACVIGTGAGGAPVAHVLAEAGMRVAVLEEGEQHAREALTARPRDMMASLYRDAAQTVTVGSPPVVLPLGRGIGGTTFVNSGTCFRTPDRIHARWVDELGLEALGPGSLDVHYEHVEREIGVSRVTEDIAGANALIAKRGAERLGWSGHFLDRNARGCKGSGVCAFGCPTGAKQDTGTTYMRWAHANGATTYTGARAA